VADSAAPGRPHRSVLAFAVMPSSLPFLGFSAVLTALVSFFFLWPVGPTALLFFVEWAWVGTLITADDDSPGGWNNPEGAIQPFASFPVTGGWASEAVIIWILSLSAVLASFGLMR